MVLCRWAQGPRIPYSVRPLASVRFPVATKNFS